MKMKNGSRSHMLVDQLTYMDAGILVKVSLVCQSTSQGSANAVIASVQACFLQK
ncbi:hypothetical protein [Brevibacillus sp. FIR094]|uniref:hypothetical protein n=1 Tax=Brevibacillus sp. FIR094 TaxID=3134809 RepID=UPI003D1BDE81